MKMRKCQLDIEKSQEVYDYFKDIIEIKKCYNNVFSVFELSPKHFREGKWKVAYGYAEVMAGLYLRHCFILDEHGAVIDPTAFAKADPQLQREHREYYVMAVFDDVDEYLTAIEENDYMPALERYLFVQDVKAHHWAKEKGIVFVK